MSLSENTSNSTDYQKTLNLPRTDFAMKANLVQREPQFLAKWEEDKIYQRLRQKAAGRKTFILHDGPPYANGHIHIGHALNKILKDIIVRYKTMKGFDAKYVPGWDCHGLPIEHQLLKDLKAKKGDFDTVVFRKKAHDYAMKFVGIQKEEFKRLGIWGEWEDPYLTLAPGYEHWILKSLASLTKRGYVYRHLKPVNWCPNCETALAEAEVEHEDKESPTVYVKFMVNDPSVLGLPTDKKAALLIWTTTPWTLLANVAVAAHPDFTYVAADLGSEILILEKSLSSAVLAKAGISDFKIIKEMKGKDLTALRYAQVFAKSAACPVVTADYVTKEDGTGLVHIAPGHGQEDYQVGLKNKLPVLMPVNPKGVFTDDGDPFTGHFIFKANPLIIENLQQRGVLLYHQPIRHSYPHCWRCKNPVITRATEQWFLKIDHEGLRQRLRDAIERDVEFVPPAGRERILGMVNTRPDWCLSRQRLWGVPIPALVCKGCKGEHKLFVEVIEYLAQLVKEHGSDVWFERSVKDLIPAGFKCPDCGGDDFEKTHDILDVWFDSGVSHQAVFNTLITHAKLPADLYLEGSDQHRGWFQSSLIPSVAIDGKAPYRQVLTHGFVVDGAGRKMSKSLGNVISPQEMIAQNGAEILRLWVASSSYNDDVRISKEIVDRLVDSYRKIRNTVRYLLGNLNGFDPDKDLLAYDRMLDLDRWALNRLALVVAETDNAYETYDFVRVYKTIHSFCNEDMSTIYLDILKDRLYTCPASSLERRSAQSALYHILNCLTRMVAPMMVVTAEEIFAVSPKAADLAEASVHLLAWPSIDRAWLSPQIEERFKVLLELRSFVLKALDEKRKQGTIGSGLEAKVVIATASDRDYTYLKSFGSELASYFIVSQVVLDKKPTVSSGLNDYFAQTSLEVLTADGVKCARCWKFTTDVGHHQAHPGLCVACAKVVEQLT